MCCRKGKSPKNYADIINRWNMTLQKCLSLVMKRLLRQKCATTSVPIRPFGVYLCALKQIVAPDKPTVCCFSIRLVLCKCLMYVYNGAGELFYTWHWIFDGIPNFVISLLLLFYCVSLFTPHFGFLLFLCVCVVNLTKSCCWQTIFIRSYTLPVWYEQFSTWGK